MGKIKCTKLECPICHTTGLAQIFLNKDGRIRYARVRHYKGLNENKKPQLNYHKITDLEALKTLLDSSMTIVTVEKIQKTISHEFKINISQLKSKNNSPKIAFPRQVAMYLSKQMTKTSLPEIGKKFGGKHHTTVLHSIKKIEKLRANDTEFDKKINTLINQIH